jgi:hypothetical protein
MTSKVTLSKYSNTIITPSESSIRPIHLHTYGTHPTGNEFARSKILLPDRFLVPKRFYWVDNDVDYPCSCCYHLHAIDSNYEYWECNETGRKWFILDEEPDLSKPHSDEICSGNCKYHPLMTCEVMVLTHPEHYNTSWGDFEEECDKYIKSLETTAETAARVVREEEERKREEVETEVRKREAYAMKMATIGSVGQRPAAATTAILTPKKQFPCKYFIGKEREESVKKGEKPECWAWEYIDPKTKKLIIKHTCPYIHPGQAGWNDEWITNPPAYGGGGAGGGWRRK